MTVADLIGVRREVYAVRDDFSVEQAARYLRDMHVRAAGVLDEHDDLVGVVSQSDIADKVAARPADDIEGAHVGGPFVTEEFYRPAL